MEEIKIDLDETIKSLLEKHINLPGEKDKKIAELEATIYSLRGKVSQAMSEVESNHKAYHEKVPFSIWDDFNSRVQKLTKTENPDIVLRAIYYALCTNFPKDNNCNRVQEEIYNIYHNAPKKSWLEKWWDIIF